MMNLNATFGGIFELSKGTIIKANTKAEKMMGYPEGGLLGKHPMDFAPAGFAAPPLAKQLQ